MSVVSLPNEDAVRRMDPLFRMAVINGIRVVVEANVRKKINLDAQDDNGTTALMLAAAKGHSAICRLLLDAGADVDVRDHSGHNAADHATLSNRASTYILIAEAMTKSSSEMSPLPVVGSIHPSLEVEDVPRIPASIRVAVQEVYDPGDKIEPWLGNDRILGGLSSWEVEAEPIRPEQDAIALRSATTESLRISLHRPQAVGEDWSGISLSLPPAPARIRDTQDTVLEAPLRRRLGSVMLQGIRSGVVHPSRISAVAAAHPESKLLAIALTTTLGDLGVGIDHDYPDLWSPIRSVTSDERQLVHQALASVTLYIVEGLDEIARLRNDIEQWSLLSRADEIVYGRQIRDGLLGALSIAARTGPILTQIMIFCDDVIEGRRMASDLLDWDEEDDWDHEYDANIEGAEESDESSRLLEHLRMLSVSLRAAFTEMKETGGPGTDPILARNTTRLLDGCKFSTAFLRTLAALEPVERHNVRLMEEYRAALRRMDYATECMILSNMKLVIWQARKYRPGSMTHADLVQEGSIGLMKAVSKFDPLRGFRFATYALWWIRQSISRAIADKDRLIRLPVHALEHHRRIQRRLSRGGNFGSLTGEDVAADLSISLRLARGMLDVFFDVESAGGLDDLAELVSLAGDCDPHGRLEAKELRREITLLLGELEPRQRDILNRRFGLNGDNDQTLEEIGKFYGVTRERIRQLEAKALAQLAHPVRSRRLSIYLR